MVGWDVDDYRLWSLGRQAWKILVEGDGLALVITSSEDRDGPFLDDEELGELLVGWIWANSIARWAADLGSGASISSSSSW